MRCERYLLARIWYLLARIWYLLARNGYVAVWQGYVAVWQGIWLSGREYGGLAGFRGFVRFYEVLPWFEGICLRVAKYRFFWVFGGSGRGLEGKISVF